MLGSISAVVFFGLSIGLVNPASEYAKFGIQHPLIMSDQATAVSYNIPINIFACKFLS